MRSQHPSGQRRQWDAIGAAITSVYELNQPREGLPNAPQSAYLTAGLGLPVIPHVPATSRNPLSTPPTLATPASPGAEHHPNARVPNGRRNLGP